MYTLNIVSTIKKMAFNELKDFIFENYYKRIGYVKESTFRKHNYSMKRLKKGFVIACNEINRKTADPSNAKEYYNSNLKRKNTKS